MGGGSVALAVAVIVGLCLFFLFIIPKGLTGITTQVIADDGVTFTNPAPTEKIEIIADCYSTKLQVNYKIDCTICTSKNINEYFWFKNSKDNEFTFLRGDRKTIFPNRDYSAEMKVDVCKGNSYSWYVCIDDGTLKCAGKDRAFRFDVR